MRTDARRNRDAIVDAARDLVSRHGAEVRMDAVATRAGVAVGTIYRHFPAKADLVHAVVVETVERIATLAEAGLVRARGGESAWDELTWFFTALDDGLSAGRTVRMAAALIGVGESADVPDQFAVPVETSSAVPSGGPQAARAREAVGELLGRAQRAGEMRPDVTLGDLFMLMAQAPDRTRPRLRARYVEIVEAGLRSSDANTSGSRSVDLK